MAVANGIIDKSGSWYSYGGSKLGQGADACKALLKDNPELLDELEQRFVKHSLPRIRNKTQMK